VRTLLAAALFAIVASCPLRPAAAHDGPHITPDVVYGHKDGMALTFDVITPAKPNGAAVLFLQSGGWYSGWQEPKICCRHPSRCSTRASPCSSCGTAALPSMPSPMR
jgi:hypothetical protein